MKKDQLSEMLLDHIKAIKDKAHALFVRPEIDMPEVKAFLYETTKKCMEVASEYDMAVFMNKEPHRDEPVKVFLSGPISSRLSTYKSEFAAWEKLVAFTGDIPINPATLPLGMEQADYMRITLAMLQSADAIMMLPGWEESTGAKLEKAYAEYTGIRVMYPDKTEVDCLGLLTTCMNERRGPKDDDDQ